PVEPALATRVAPDAALICALLSGEVCHKPRSLITVLAEVSPPLPPVTRPVGRGGRNSTGRRDAGAGGERPARRDGGAGGRRGCFAARGLVAGLWSRFLGFGGASGRRAGGQGLCVLLFLAAHAEQLGKGIGDAGGRHLGVGVA